MQLASHGARRAPNLVRTGGGGTHNGGGMLSRALHVPSFVPRAPPKPANAQKLLSYSRHIVTRFFAHLTAPGLAAPRASMQAAPSAVRARTIHQGLSFPARHALGRPLGAPVLPRAPTVPRPNAVTNVGLGTARNFHAARPIFANLVENVPVCGRAFWEAEWDVRTREERARLSSKPMKNAAKKAKGKDMLKPSSAVFDSTVSDEKENASVAGTEELERYFPAPARAHVTTYLLIPLAPTPTERLPLPPNPNPSHDPGPRVPIRALAHLHSDHALHATRVSSLFARLDAGDVWSQGASCAAYSESGVDAGVCAVLRVEFAGWEEKAVRGVIGECGSGWCALEEVRHAEEQDSLMLPESEMGSESEMEFGSGIGMGSERARSVYGEEDTAHSFVLPTLDFSSSFLQASSPSPSSPAPLSRATSFGSGSGSDMDDLLSLSSGSCGRSWLDANLSLASEAPRSVSGSDGSSWVGFSSSFARQIEEEPREAMF